jgi:hypothetical protein
MTPDGGSDREEENEHGDELDKGELDDSDDEDGGDTEDVGEGAAGVKDMSRPNLHVSPDQMARREETRLHDMGVVEHPSNVHHLWVTRCTIDEAWSHYPNR